MDNYLLDFKMRETKFSMVVIAILVVIMVVVTYGVSYAIEHNWID